MQLVLNWSKQRDGVQGRRQRLFRSPGHEITPGRTRTKFRVEDNACSGDQGRSQRLAVKIWSSGQKATPGQTAVQDSSVDTIDTETEGDEVSASA